MRNFRNIETWKVAHQLTIEVYHVTRLFPDDERYGLTSQLRRASVSIESNIAERAGRGSDRDFARFLDQAAGSACEVECQLLVANDLGYIVPQTVDPLITHVQRVKRMITGLTKSLRK